MNMVKAKKVGKRRPFWRGFLLTVVTFGIYGIYWNYKAHHEVFSQFDLDDEGRDEGVVWLVLGILFGPILWVYQYGFVRNVVYVRNRLGLGQGVTPKTFLALVIVGAAVGIAFVIVAQVMVAAVAEPAGETIGEDEAATVLAAVSLMLLGLVISVILMAIAYAKLQGSINALWDAYDRRVRELTAPPAPSAPPFAPAAGATAPWSSSPSSAPSPRAPGPGAGPR